MVTRTRDDKGRFVTEPGLFVEGHHYSISESGCWVWQHRIDRTGYGRTRKGSGGTNRLAHRVAYENLVGPIPSGLELDHLCRVRACINPKHLEPVTRQENVLRGQIGKVPIEQRAEIRREVLALAKKYGVKPRTLAAIANREAGY